MTEHEKKAIKWMQNVRDDAVVTLDHIAKEESNVSPMLYAGRKEKAEAIIKGFEELEQYREIGTVEEYRASLEKQTAAKPLGGMDIEGNEYAICRECSAILSDGEWFAQYCPDCGKKVDWREKEKG